MSDFERSLLERKDRDELSKIALSLGQKPPSRAKKADMVDLILRLAGVPVDGAAATEPRHVAAVAPTPATPLRPGAPATNGERDDEPVMDHASASPYRAGGLSPTCGAGVAERTPAEPRAADHADGSTARVEGPRSRSLTALMRPPRPRAGRLAARRRSRHDPRPDDQQQRRAEQQRNDQRNRDQQAQIDRNRTSQQGADQQGGRQPAAAATSRVASRAVPAGWPGRR